MFAVAVSMNTYGNLGVLAVVTWQVLFVSIPMVFLAILLQVNTKLQLIAFSFFFFSRCVMKNKHYVLAVLNIFETQLCSLNRITTEIYDEGEEE